MKQDIEDYLYDIKSIYQIDFDWDKIDEIIDNVIKVAKHRY